MSLKGKKGSGLSSDQKEKLLRKMRERRQRRDHRSDADGQDAPDLVVAAANVPVSDDLCSFEQMPGYIQLQLHHKFAERANIASPFFIPHEGVGRDTTVIAGQEYINFSSYNYLDLCGHPEVNAAAKAAIDTDGTSVSASRIVSGERKLHAELETAITELYGVEDCITYVSGHATNVSVIGQMFGARDLVIHDALAHNSIIQGALLSGAKRIVFAHNDLDNLEDILVRNRSKCERVLIVTEGLYSMDGDVSPLDKLIEIKKRHKAFLMVDEAHSLGVVGERGLGVRELYAIDGKDVDIWMGTLSKSFAGCGGFIAGTHALVEYLKFTSPGFVYSVGMPPPVAAASLAAIKLMQREPERLKRLYANARKFLELARESGLDTGLSQGHAIIPVITGNSINAVRLSNALHDRGINVRPIIYPAVEEKAARLRFFISSAHNEEQIRTTIDVIVEEMARLHESLPATKASSLVL